MSDGETHARTPGRSSPSWIFRGWILIPAVLTGFAVVLSARWRSLEGPPQGGGRTLTLGEGVRELPIAEYGPPLTDVFSATDAVEVAGGWAVLDGRSQRIALLDERANLRVLAGGRGQGPGEMVRSMALARSDSLLVVVEAGGDRLHYFGPDGAFLKVVALTTPAGCTSAPARQLEGASGHVVLLRICARSDGRSSAMVERLNASEKREVLANRVFSDPRSAGLDPSRTPMLALVDARLYMGLSPDPCVRLLGEQMEDAICHPNPDPIPLSEADRSAYRDMEPQLREIGVSLVVPDHYPPFDAIHAVGGRLAFQVVLGDRERALDVAGESVLERFTLPTGARIFFGARTVLLARELAEGTAFAVLPIP